MSVPVDAGPFGCAQTAIPIPVGRPIDAVQHPALLLLVTASVVAALFGVVVMRRRRRHLAFANGNGKPTSSLPHHVLHLHDLPTEVLAKVFGHLSARDMGHACAASKSMRAATRDMMPSWLGVIHLRLWPSEKDMFWTGRDPVLDPANLGQWPADVYTDGDQTPDVRSLLAQCPAWPNIAFVFNVQEATPLPRLRRWVLADPPANLLGVGILLPGSAQRRDRRYTALPASWRRQWFDKSPNAAGDGDEQPSQPEPPIIASCRPSSGRDTRGSMTLSDCFGLKHFLDAGHEDAWIKIADFQTLGRLDLDMHRMP